MDEVLIFYQFTSYPICIADKSSKQRHLAIIWCVISLLWYLYQYGHTWLARNLVYLFNKQNFADKTTSVAMSRVFNVIFEIGWPTALKIYLIWAHFRKSSPLVASINNLTNATTSFQSGLHLDALKSKCRSYERVLLGAQLVLCCLAAYLSIDYLNQCRTSADLCNFLFITPWLDHVGEFETLLVMTMSISILPILVGVACLRFSHNVQAACSSSMHIDAIKTSLIETLFTAQFNFVKHFEGWLCALISFSAVSIILSVTLLAIKVSSVSLFVVLWIVIHFGNTAFLCYASSMADEAVSSGQKVIYYWLNPIVLYFRRHGFWINFIRLDLMPRLALATCTRSLIAACLTLW